LIPRYFFHFYLSVLCDSRVGLHRVRITILLKADHPRMRAFS